MIENIFDILDNLFRFIYILFHISAIITIKNRYQNTTKDNSSANECQIKLEVDQL